MPTTINKQRLLSQLFACHKKIASHSDPGPGLTLEQFVYGICREGTTRKLADRAYRNLCESFFDWNEIRVSSVRELEEALAVLPNPTERAERLISFLQEVFETTYSFDLEGLQKKGLKQAVRQLGRFQAANPYIIAWVTQQSLGGHAIPLDEPTLRVVRRLGLVDEDETDLDAVRASLERQIPRTRAAQFGEVASFLADELCWEEDPHCTACPLASCCQTGQESTRPGAAPSRTVTRARPG